MNPPSEPEPQGGDEFDARSFLQQLTHAPGVYRMYGGAGELLYVGKARNLRKRVGTYFLRASGNARIESMVSQIRRIEVTVTHTEDEALILEATLIKEQQPRYNILYRDDKSYPYVRLSAHAFPRISYYRGEKRGRDQYFGPFPSATAVRDTLYTLQKLFLLRPCRDSFFAHRDRACLQYQIKRCSGPCVGLISPEDYARDVRNAARLLEGRGDELADELAVEMERAAEALAFERAARLRDQISALKRVRESRSMTGGASELDVIAVAPHPSQSCVVVMSVRDGMNMGHRSHFPRHPPHAAPEALLESFLGQHYLGIPTPGEILLSHVPEELDWIAAALGQTAGRRIRLAKPQRGAKLRLLEMAQNTANQALSARLADMASMDARLLELQGALDLPHPPRRLECFDISHTGGERAVASCVVFNEHGPLKTAYRKFNIEGITPGDDYAAIRQAVMRRFARVKGGEVQAPDLLLIDGGQGQLDAALEGLEAVDFTDVRVVGVAKGPTRKAGMEELIVPERAHPLRLPPDSPALHLIQRIRDEAHRFAITGHRGRRDKARLTSDLDAIEGLGPARKRALLRHFGGLPQLRRAAIDDLARVEGISRRLAERIYRHFQ
ncbi:excinuclease ABC subunit UvrC [Flagellatimonas centrodinii]|uniref:excinuclease ABC subunit UvrC n=1 Tax=Flagellatimonas centrodinii TaxID=2806210 RepID=UPI001FEF8907|nr:excinuclease ABC subunit UvrC [Flagellatimonas centrodinii]ULQ46282.1 excinuclease ABC subunit UvrC [Flagellatimonas centrodinii]